MNAIDLVPPHDRDAEAAIVGSVLMGERTSVVELAVDALYCDDLRQVLLAAHGVEESGRTVTVESVTGYLRDHGRLERVGGASFVADLLAAAEQDHKLPGIAERVQAKARLRDVIQTAKRLTVEGYSADDPDELLRRFQEATKGKIGSGRSIPWETADAVFQKLPPVPWVCKDLYLASGRPCLLMGYGYSGKSIAAQALLLSIASGKFVWGRFYVHRPGRVLHLDHEQGRRATFLRYQRLARGMGIDPASLQDTLRVASIPDFRLTDSDAEKRLTASVEGVNVCLIDSLRATIEGVDENDSTVRAFLDRLLRVSEATGCVFIVIHHSGKGSGERDEREAARGSSAIFDACGTVLRLVGELEGGGTNVKVSMAKTCADACGSTPDPFFLRIADVTEGTDITWGLECSFRTAEQIAPPVSREEARAQREEAILSFLRSKPGASTNMIRSAVAGRAVDVNATLDDLQIAGRVTSGKGPRSARVWNVTEGNLVL